MPVKKITASISYQTIFDTPEHKIGKISSIQMVNKSATSIDVMATFEDFFTPDASHGTASPSATSQEAARLLVGAGLQGTLGEEELKDVRVLDELKAICDATDTGVHISVFYDLV